MNSPLLDALTALIRQIDHTKNLKQLQAGATLNNARLIADRARSGYVTSPPWTPFEPTEVGDLSVAQLASARRRLPHLSDREVHRLVAEMHADTRYFVNSRYQVAVTDGAAASVHLSIKRLDQGTIHDWRDLQRIKDELLGPHCEAVELYPARDRLVDLANQYHLWGVRDPTFRFPLGFQEGMAADTESGGAAQRPRDPGALDR